MKNHFFNKHIVGTFLIVACSLYSCSTQKWAVPSDLTGEWISDMTKITVRTSPKWMKFEFTSDISLVSLTIENDKTASGFIGSAEFKNGIIRKNLGNPEKTGVAYIIQCGSIKRIFPTDPLDDKQVEIWLGPLKGVMYAGLRYTEGGSQFPMAHLTFRKVMNK